MRLIASLTVLVVLAGAACERTPSQAKSPAATVRPCGTSSASQPDSRPATSSPVDSINEQIVRFNANRTPQMGISPIEVTAHKLTYDAKTDSIACLDREGKSFLKLLRQPDRTFKGTLEVDYHQLASATGSHSWGRVIVTFDLPPSAADMLKIPAP